MSEGTTDPGDLPRLLYVADVPVENSLHGSSLLYRLLLNYPKERLLVVETGTHASLPERRLLGVQYRFVPQRFERLRRTRLVRFVESAAMVTARAKVRAIRKASAEFHAEAVLTVTHGGTWLSAVALAGRLAVPYHLICHDEWASGGITMAALASWKKRAFARAYRGAISRMCVSPAMAATYLSRYGAKGTVLYPARSPTSVTYQGLSSRLEDGNGGRVFAFAGSMNTKEMVDANVRLAKAIEPLGGTLAIYGPATIANNPALDRPNIAMRGMLTPDALSAALRRDVDALFLPMWFGAGERDNERLCFPSKLTDYTNVGLPILVTGDPDCAAAVWEQDNPGVALVQNRPDAAALAADARRLFEDRTLARSLAARAKQVGDAMFASEAAERVFFAALTGPMAPSELPRGG